MPAGGKGDEPYLDIVAYKLSVFSEKADILIREVSVLMTSVELESFREELFHIQMSENLNIDKFEERLERMKRDLLSRARECGWDV